MSGGIYRIGDDGGLEELRECAYDSENLLQELLARYPSLLAGDQMNRNEPRRWLLVSREIPVPGEQDGAGRWSLDHLFLDQDGIPTLVEVKRSSDTRLRREVVGQMLDHAANSTLYWPAESIRARFEARCEKGGMDPAQELVSMLGEDVDSERFWQSVRTNLQAGRIRMVFVADQISTELQRIIEFPDGQMISAEVRGVAIQQYAGHGQKMFVPRVVGQMAAAQQRKSAGEARQWEEGSFFQ